MVEEYTEKYGSSPSVETRIPESSEELLSILKSYKVVESEDEVVLAGEASPVKISTPRFLVDNKLAGEKKHGFFSKIRSIFMKPEL